MSQAVDSWFPEYYWGYLLICTECSTPVHLGWKFVPKTKTGLEGSFYALIVDYTDDRKQRVATRMDVLVMEELRVGVTAPSWMVAMLATHLSINGATKPAQPPHLMGAMWWAVLVEAASTVYTLKCIK
eukprot:1257196-Pyramimonas_sp.AAC.1